MSSKPLVSVVTIFLNAEQFIQAAIESVFAQTYDSWELLLVDDGSTDGSTEIALRYARQYPWRVRYLEHPGHQNRGMSAARNLGSGNAQGEYIAFVDADDVWLPYKLEQQVAILDSQPKAGMLYAPTQYWYSWTGKSEDSGRDFVPALGLQANTLVVPPTLLMLFLRGKAKPPGTCSVLLRREIIEAVGGFVEAFRGLYEDQAFFAKVCLSVPVFVVGEYSARYRQHPNSCCSVAENTGEKDSAELIYLRWLAAYVPRHEDKDGEDWSVLEKILWPYRHPILYRLLGRALHLLKQREELQMREILTTIARRTLPIPVRRWLWALWQLQYRQPVGQDTDELDRGPYRHPILYGLCQLLGRAQPVVKHMSNVSRIIGNQPHVAYEPDLIPPLYLMRQEGIDVLEEWFRWAEEWSMLLRVYGGITKNNTVLEIGCGLGRIAFPLRYILSSDGMYDGFDICHNKIAFLEQTFHKAHPNFRFTWADIHNTYYNPKGQIHPADYRFPSPDERFEIVYAASVFTHMLPEGTANYFRESARVLKPHGRCLFSFFLLDHYRSGQPRPLGFARPIFNFDHHYGPYGDEFAIVKPDNPEYMTAYSLRLIERFATQAGLALAQAPVPGLWSGTTSNWVGAQDLVILSKRR